MNSGIDLARAGNRQRIVQSIGSGPDCKNRYRGLQARGLSYPTLRLAGNARRIARLVDHLWTNPEASFTIEQMMQLTAMSRRTLFYNFSRLTGHTPQKYFKLVRLQFVHEELSNGVSGVTQLAFKYNFNHLGEFSALYRQVYGVLPSVKAKQGGSTRLRLAS